MIDSHCHLDHEPLFNQISEVLVRSKNAGIKKLLTICTTNESFKKILELIKLDSMIYGTFGIHPHEANKDIVNTQMIINNIKKDKKLIGVGESGLDFYYNHSDKDKQVLSFKSHIEASIELKIPIIVHSRNAENETFDILNSYKKNNPKILMHCFTGSKKFADRLMSFNTFFSASGIITFKNSNDLQDTFKEIPLDRLLIETDSPFLAPMPKRGKKNEPSYIKYTLDMLSELKEISSSKISDITTQNFENLFSL
tara:strand:+ start:1563 stop:2324 length:762 start_codon:yes stop_codon:yes gene_type:complete